MFRFRDQVVGLVGGLWRTPAGWAFLAVCQAAMGFNLAVFLWRVVLVRRYRPPPPPPDDRLPACTVVVPAYNEGRSVVQTLRSLAACDYPPGRLQIIAVDDGSGDDTWHWMQQAARGEGVPPLRLAGVSPAESNDNGQHKGETPSPRTHPIELVRLSRNRGKRFALAEGFRRSRGEMLVTVDSDSIVEPSALRRLAGAFEGHPNVGAVGGNIRVHNRSEGAIGRMLDVSFAYSFDFIRSSQSEVDTVMCIPGALAAYRRGVVMDVLEEWVAQLFMGRPANIGEDRALTNLILRNGLACRYQADAVCFTAVPTGYRGLCRMFIRWARSNVRETIAMGRFVFGRFRQGPRLGARINLVHQAVGMFLNPLLLLGAVGLLGPWPIAGVLNFLLGCVVAGAVPAAFYALRHRTSDALWAFPYGLFWLVGLSWINLYSLLTPQKSAWLTRQLPANPPPSGCHPQADSFPLGGAAEAPAVLTATRERAGH